MGLDFVSCLLYLPSQKNLVEKNLEHSSTCNLCQFYGIAEYFCGF